MTTGGHYKRAAVITSSDDLYGADKICSQVASVLGALKNVNVEVWVPADTAPKPNSRLSSTLQSDTRRFVVTMPILRRQYMNFFGFLMILKRFFPAAKLLRNRQINVVYLGTSACLPVGIIARLCGIRTVIFHMQEIWKGPEGKVMSILSRSASQIICISEASFQSLPEHLRARATVIPNGVEGPTDAALDRRSDHPTTFLMASRWNSWKGHGTLISAWSQVGHDKRLIILGGPPEIGARVDVNLLVSKLPNAETVSVVGEVSDIADYLREADFMIVPSDQPEPFGLVAIEAMSLGVPVIGSAGGGLAEVVDHGRTGYLFPFKDHLRLAELILKVSQENTMQMAAAAKAEFESRFSVNVFNREIEKLFKTTKLFG